jgi:hypothetical protein
MVFPKLDFHDDRMTSLFFAGTTKKMAVLQPQRKSP